MIDLRRGDQDSKEDLGQRTPKNAEAECKKALDKALALGLEDTFPGSDPVAVTQPLRSASDKCKP